METESACESIAEEGGGGGGSRKSSRGPTMSRGGPLICLPNNRRLDLVAVKTTSNNRPFFRAAERKDEGTSTRAPFDRTVVQSQSAPIVLRYHESSIYVLTNWKYLFRGYCTGILIREREEGVSSLVDEAVYRLIITREHDDS